MSIFIQSIWLFFLYRYLSKPHKGIFDSNYKPTDQDILHNRTRTQRFNEFTFNIEIPQPFKIYEKFSQTFRLFDIGKQILEKTNTKWLQVFDGIQILLFIISVNNFNKIGTNNNKNNLLKDDLKKFSAISNSPYLNVTGILVFLNKIDLMEEKMLNGIQFGEQYTDYNDFHLDLTEKIDDDECLIFLEMKRAKNYIIDMLIVI